MNQNMNTEVRTGAIYMGGGIWNIIAEDGVKVGTLSQGFDSAWSARNAENKIININGHRYYGGTERPFIIARDMVNWME